MALANSEVEVRAEWKFLEEMSEQEFLLVINGKEITDRSRRGVCIWPRIDGYEEVCACMHVILLGPFSDEEEVTGVKVEKNEKCIKVEEVKEEKDVEVNDVGSVGEVVC